jgi:hypothetical protein
MSQVWQNHRGSHLDVDDGTSFCGTQTQRAQASQALEDADVDLVISQMIAVIDM